VRGDGKEEGRKEVEGMKEWGARGGYERMVKKEDGY
jgi:hypothetical protein